MEDGHFNCGLNGGLFESKHYNAMGDAVWLFGWLVHRQTQMNGSVLNGTPILDCRIAKDTGHPLKRIRRWRDTLLVEPGPYIEVKRTPIGHIYRILKPKKFTAQQIPLPMEELPVPKNGNLLPEQVPKNGNLSAQKWELKRLQTVELQKSNTRERERARVETTELNEPVTSDRHFERFWNVYPNKQQRPSALTAWRMLRSMDLYSDIEAGLKRWIASARWKNEPQFIPYPAKFLKERQWENKPPEEKSNGTDQSNSKRAGAYHEQGKTYRQPTVL